MNGLGYKMVERRLYHTSRELTDVLGQLGITEDPIRVRPLLQVKQCIGCGYWFYEIDELGFCKDCARGLMINE